MLTIHRYQCEICRTEFDSAAEAERCESTGLPAPVPWLPMPPREPLPVFGEGGVQFIDEISRIEIQRKGSRHVWRLWTRPLVHVSHNMNPEDGLPVEAFDPRVGCDAFRYGNAGVALAPGCSDADLQVWDRTMQRYGFAEESADIFVRTRVTATRARSDPNHPRVLHGSYQGLFVTVDADIDHPISVHATEPTNAWGELARARVFTTNVESLAMAFGCLVVPLAVIELQVSYLKGGAT